jgi:hypothetical protein
MFIGPSIVHDKTVLKQAITTSFNKLLEFQNYIYY